MFSKKKKTFTFAAWEEGNEGTRGQGDEETSKQTPNKQTYNQTLNKPKQTDFY
jgi:hypothetical protein